MPKGSHVLMADDDRMLVDMYKERLELAGYKITVTRNGEDALAQVRSTKPDLVMLDVMMPKLNGYETLASIKSDPQTKNIPVIMLSALMRDFNREKAVEAGADDYLIKSEAMPADVITKIEQVLQKYGKGAVPAPGTVASSIPSQTAQVPEPVPHQENSFVPVSSPNPISSNPPSTPTISEPLVLSSVPSNTDSNHHDLSNQSLDLSTKNKDAVTAPDKIMFEPAQESQADIETKPAGINSEPVLSSESAIVEEKVEEKAEASVVTVPQKPPAQQEPKDEEVPVVKLGSSPQPAAFPAQPPINLTPTSVGEQIPIHKEKQIKPEAKVQSPASVAMIVVIVILMTTLINDLIIYYFFFLK